MENKEKILRELFELESKRIREFDAKKEILTSDQLDEEFGENIRMEFFIRDN
jgi:hypothetical protein